jgi:uncharacterized delta-60 repeat protein
MTAGSPDLNLNIGSGFLNNDTSNGNVRTIDIDSSNNIFCGGFYENYNGNPINNIVKIDNDGNLDMTFLANTSGGTNGEIFDLKVLSDDTIIIIGSCYVYGGIYVSNIFKLNNDGTIDTTFNGGVGFAGGGGYALKIGQQSDGKIVAVGDFTKYDSNFCNYITRINTDGSFDNTFNIGAGFDGGVPLSLKILSDDSIIVVGNFTSYDGNDNFKIVKLLSDGTQDFTFNNLGFDINSSASGIDIQSDGKIIVCGILIQYGTNICSSLTRLNSDGTFDTTFILNNSPNLIGPAAQSVKVLTDDRICIGGLAVNEIYDEYWNVFPYILYSFGILKANGNLDNDFIIGGGFSASDITFKEDNNGKLLIGGNFNLYNNIYSYNSLVRLETQTPTLTLSAGSIDTSFIIERGFLGGPYVYTPLNFDFLSDGSIVICGSLTYFNYQSTTSVIKLFESGSLDNDFNSNILTIPYDWIVINIKTQPDNKILTIGDYLLPTKQITRLNSDGTLDTTFSQNYGTGINGNLYAIELQNDNILLGGYFTSFNSGGTVWNGICRLFNNGDVDELFNFGGSGFDLIGTEGVSKILVQQYDNKILVGGVFSMYNGITVSNNLIRLNSDGTLDTTFNSLGSGFDNNVFDIALQSDNKIVVLGDFTTYNGVLVGPYIVRLNPDGSIDTSFNITDITTKFDAIVIQSDGKIILSSQSNTVINGVSLYPAVNSIIRLNTDGSLDNTFHIGYGANFSIIKIKINNNKLYVIGDMSTYDS